MAETKALRPGMRSLAPSLAPFLAIMLSGCAGIAMPERPAPAAGLYADYLTGRYANLRRDTNVATDRYLNALRRSPGDVVLLDGAVDTALSGGNLPAAEEAARIAMRKGAQTDLGRLTLAAVALRMGDYRATEARLAEADIGSFDRLAAVMMRGWALAGRGQTDEAATIFGNAGGGGPFRALYEYQRGLVLDYAGRNDEALAAYQTAEMSGARLAPALIRHVRLLERMGRGGEAETLLKTYIARAEDPDIVAELARVEAGKPASTTRLAPADGAAIGLYSIAAALLGQSDPDFFLPFLTLAETLDPNLSAAWIMHGEGQRQVKQFAGARAAFARVPAASPWYETAQTRIAWIYREEGDDAQALAVARAIAAQSPGRLARITLADMERASDNWAAADTLYSALIAEAAPPTKADWSLYFARGSSRDQLGRWAEGEADLKQALVLSPDQPEVLNYLGYSWVDKGQNLDEALAMLRKAVSMEPDAGYIVDSLGWAHFKLGDYEIAAENLERAVELSPEDPTLNDHLGDAYWRLNRRLEARYQWQRALTLDPAEKDKAAIELKVKQGLPDLPAPRRTARDQGRSKAN